MPADYVPSSPSFLPDAVVGARSVPPPEADLEDDALALATRVTERIRAGTLTPAAGVPQLA